MIHCDHLINAEIISALNSFKKLETEFTNFVWDLSYSMICLDLLTTVHYCNPMTWYQVISACLVKHYFVPMVIVQRQSRWELSMPRKHLTEKCHSWQASLTLNSRRNWLGVMFGALLFMAQRSGHQENWSGVIWRALKCGAGGEWRR